ncbi:hypothetical protein N7461_005577 [Penicillium sp. DV-2018c]|nr:hypothetical protein N7461_005577 [Penicillium sp. DV-2018c]
MDQVRRTTLAELICHCHLLSRPLRAWSGDSGLTTGTISLPKGKYCPTRLEQWVDCTAQQQDIYDAVRRYLQPEENPPRLFSPRDALDDNCRIMWPIYDEKDVWRSEWKAVERFVHDIILELCKIPAAREEFGLGDDFMFGGSSYVLGQNEIDETDMNNSSADGPGRLRQEGIQRVDGNISTLIATVEYGSPRKLSLEVLRMGLSDIDLWKEVIRADKMFVNEADRSVYNAQRLVCAALVQQYHVMIEQGLEYSYLTTGITRVLLWVPREKPSTLYYHLCVPNEQVDGQDGDLAQPNTSIARVLCLCLMSLRSRQRDQEWRNWHRSTLHTTETDFDHSDSNAATEELQPNQPSNGADYVSPESDSNSLTSQTALAVAEQKRGYSQQPSQPSPHQNEIDRQNDISQRRNAQFCTQRCLRGLRKGGPMDNSCPNVDLHRRGGNRDQHSINAVEFISLLKQQMDEDIDRCIPYGSCGSYGAPFKLTCSIHGYTVIGKGTTSYLWTKYVSREAKVYRILRKVQGYAVPVFLGKLDLAKIYFHCGGHIRHMLVMGWAGESIAKLERTPELTREIERSENEVRALGVQHLDLRDDNILWNGQLGRAMIIDFHLSKLDRNNTTVRPKSLKRSRCETEAS